MIIAIVIAWILIVVSFVFALIEYHFESKADLKILDKLEHDLMVRHLKEVNPK